MHSEVQSEEKEGNTAEWKDFEWNGKIGLSAPEDMSLTEVQAAVAVQAGSGENDPEIAVAEQDGKYVLSGTGYEKDGEKGFEPGSTFSLTVTGDVHFANYAEEITTLVVSVYKEQIETVAFADDMHYVLWDDVISYIPAKEQTEDDLTADAEKLLESEETELADTESETESLQEETADTELTSETETETETESETSVTGEENGSEWEMPAYIPGEIVVKGDTDYQEGELVAFYDGDIGRDEKTMDSYVEGSYDGYVLYAKVQATEKTDQGTQITFQYASPGEYLADFDVHMTEEANLEQELSAVVYETTFTSSHMLGGFYEPTDTGILSLGEIVSEAQTRYPELATLNYSWSEPMRDDSASVVQYSVPRISDFCYMTPNTGTVRYDVKPQTEESEVTYYLYVRRFEGYEDKVRYHVRLTGADPKDTYEFSARAAKEGEVFTFTEEKEHTYLLPVRRSQFDGSDQPLMMSVNGQEAFKTGFVINGQETQEDVYFDLSAGTAMLGIQLGEGVEGYEFTDPSIVTEDGIKPGTKVELKVQLKDGYGGLEALCDKESIDITVEDTTVRFTMPVNGISLTLQAYKLHSITYMYHYKGNGVYKKEYFAENERTEKVKNPSLDGLTFRGWYTSPEYKGSEYQFGEKLTTDVILYADWTCDVTVHFSPAKGKAAYRLADGTQQAFFKQTEKTYYTYTYSTQRPGEKLPDLVIPEYDGYQFMD